MKPVKGYSFDDVLLVPRYSELESRNESSIKSKVGKTSLDVPILSAPMDTVTEENMAMFMWESGGMGVIHRYNSVNRQYSMVRWVREYGARVGAAVGINGDSKERVDALAEADVDVIVLDIAHGHMKKALDLVSFIKSNYPNISVMSANIVTVAAAMDYMEAGADILRVGVGPGSACSTRTVAGVGYPQLSAISNIYEYIRERQSYNKYISVDVVSDGGIRSSGDIVKALAAGADAVMVGGILAPFEVAAGRVTTKKVGPSGEAKEVYPGAQERFVMMKEFRGMASDSALSERKNNFVVEGESFWVPLRYDHKEFIKSLASGIQQGFSYLGAKDIYSLRKNAEFVEVTSHGYEEGTPHFERR